MKRLVLTTVAVLSLTAAAMPAAAAVEFSDAVAVKISQKAPPKCQCGPTIRP